MFCGGEDASTYVALARTHARTYVCILQKFRMKSKRQACKCAVSGVVSCASYVHS